MSYIIAIVLIILKIIDSIYENNHKKTIEKNIPKKDNIEQIKNRIDNIKDEEMKTRLTKLLKNAEAEFSDESEKEKTLNKKLEEKRKKISQKKNEPTINVDKKIKKLAIVDSRSLENAIPHTDDSV